LNEQLEKHCSYPYQLYPVRGLISIQSTHGQGNSFPVRGFTEINECKCPTDKLISASCFFMDMNSLREKGFPENSTCIIDVNSIGKRSHGVFQQTLMNRAFSPFVMESFESFPFIVNVSKIFL